MVGIASKDNERFVSQVGELLHQLRVGWEVEPLPGLGCSGPISKAALEFGLIRASGWPHLRKPVLLLRMGCFNQNDALHPISISARKHEHIHPAERLTREHQRRLDPLRLQQREEIMCGIETRGRRGKLAAATQPCAVINAYAGDRGDLWKHRGPPDRRLPGKGLLGRNSHALLSHNRRRPVPGAQKTQHALVADVAVVKLESER